VKRNKAIDMAIESVKKESRMWRSIAYPYLKGQITDKKTSHYKAAQKIEEFDEVITQLESMKQKQIKLEL